MMRSNKEPANTRVVNRVEMVRAVVIKVLPAKYFPTSYQAPSSLLAR